MSADLKAGDVVRATLYGDVSDDGWLRFHGMGNDVIHMRPESAAVISIEVVPPPVEVFKPGDRVRLKAYDGSAILHIGHGGFFNESQHRWYTATVAAEPITSELYERVQEES